MAYEPTMDQLIEDCQSFLDSDPRYWDQDAGYLLWAGKVVEFSKTANEVTLNVEGESITFPRP